MKRMRHVLWSLYHRVWTPNTSCLFVTLIALLIEPLKKSKIAVSFKKFFFYLFLKYGYSFLFISS